jgi:hypothetical protein
MTHSTAEPRKPELTTYEYFADDVPAAKYSCQGPRYTSYPTAMLFREDFAQDQYDNWLHTSDDRKNAPLSVYVHLPFCQDICYYCGCNKIVTREKMPLATTCVAYKWRYSCSPNSWEAVGT